MNVILKGCIYFLNNHIIIIIIIIIIKEKNKINYITHPHGEKMFIANQNLNWPLSKLYEWAILFNFNAYSFHIISRGESEKGLIV